MAAIVPDACLHQSVEAAARAYPSAPAIVCNGASLTYNELMARAHQVAGYLRSSGIGEGSTVALYLPRSPDLIVAQLAVLATGAAYLSLDRSHPRERKRLVIADARPALIVTLQSLVDDLGHVEHLLLMDAAAPHIAAVASESFSAGTPDSLAYVTYTSGSTGGPKGVLSHHRGAANYIAYMISARHLEPGERVLQFTSLSFDGSVRDTIGTLIFGGAIVLLDDESARDPLALLAAIRDERATLILCIVPTMLRALTRAALDGGSGKPGIRLIMVGGEALLRDDVEKARQAFGADLQIVNQYGATECSMVAADYPVPAELPAGTTDLPIGRPIANSRIYILDRELEPVTRGSEGELYVGGLGVGLGYLNRPDLTAERFVPDPHGVTPHARMYRTGDLARHLPDGTLQYLGRADQQVKIKGNRVELGEIESVLLAHPAMHEAAVIFSKGAERDSLVAYVTRKGEAGIGDLHAFLAARLPVHMIPSSFILLDDMPLTQSGKVDRVHLPRRVCDRSARTIIPARNRMEARLISIWESVLGVRQIGVEDDFMELGGDSLQAAEMFARIEHEFGRALPSSTLSQHGTVGSLARLLETETARPRDRARGSWLFSLMARALHCSSSRPICT